MAESLKTKTINGVIWSGMQKAGSILLSFISSIVLARLLTPDDYGCIGMLAIFLALSNTFIDGGFGSALIQKKRPTNEDYSTIFYWNLFLSICLYLILFFCAPFIAKFYHQDILCPVLRVQGIVLIFNAIKLVQFNQLKKQLLFKRIAIVDVSVSAISLAVTIYLAWRNFGVWSLVVQQLLVGFLSAITYWILSGWKPLLCFSKQSFKELFGFGGFILLSNLINTFCNNIQGVLIGRFYSPATMGYYSKAKSTEEISSTFISQVMDQVAYPVLSEAQDDKAYMIRMLKQFIGVLAYITFPMMLVLILLAKPIFVLLYTETWLPSVPYFQILCIAGIAICLQGINYYAVAAIGKSKAMFVWTIIKRLIALMFVIGGLLLFDMIGLLWGTVLGTFSVYIINAFLVSKYIGYSIWNQFKDLQPIIIISVITFLCVYILGNIIDINIYIKGCIQIAIFMLVYVGLSKILKIESYFSSITIIKQLIHKFTKNDKN